MVSVVTKRHLQKKYEFIQLFPENILLDEGKENKKKKKQTILDDTR